MSEKLKSLICLNKYSNLNFIKMKKLILTLVFVFATITMVNAKNEVKKDCFLQAIKDLENFEKDNGFDDDEVGAAILNEAYYHCWAGF